MEADLGVDLAEHLPAGARPARNRGLLAFV